MGIVIFLIVILIAGALLGGRSFGGTLRKGLGCFAIVLIVVLGVLLFTIAGMDGDDKSPQEKQTNTIENANFRAKHNCDTYSKPNISSNISGFLEADKVLYIENTDKYNYFYQWVADDGSICYILKEDLIRTE